MSQPRRCCPWGERLLFALISGGFAFARLQPDSTGFVVIGVFNFAFLIAWIVVYIGAYDTAINAKEITSREMILIGVSGAFIRAVAERDIEWSPTGRLSKPNDDGRFQSLPPKPSIPDAFED